MCALAHWFEGAGVASVLIGLIPQHVERMRPPRALLVPFELGRPLGVSRDRHFQGRVVDAAVELVERVDVPVITWFDEPAPAGEQPSDSWACPVSFAPPATELNDLLSATLAEVALLQPWHDRAVAARGSDAGGVSELEIETAVRHLYDFLGDDLPGPANPHLSLADGFKLAAEDLKLFYYQAASAQPGASSRDLADWFWNHTSAAELLRALVHRLADVDHPALRAFARFTLVPEARLKAAGQRRSDQP